MLLLLLLLVTAEEVAHLRKENEELRNEIARYRRIIDDAGKLPVFVSVNRWM